MIKKLDFAKSKSIGEDFDVIIDKIDELIDSVNNINNKKEVLESKSRYLTDNTDDMKAIISDLVASPANIDDLKVDKTDISDIERIKTGATNVEKNSSFSTPTPWEPYKEDKCLKLGATSPVANEITFKLSSLEGDETIITINKDCITMSRNKKDINIKGTTCIEVGKLTDEMAKRFELGKYSRR